MRILTISDLHIDSGPDVAKEILTAIKMMRSDFDVLVIAGDISNAALETAEFLRKAVYAAFKDVVFVPGNHEYYSFDMNYATSLLMGMNDRREYMHKLHVLNDTSRALKIRGKEYLFVGSTLWTDFRIMGDLGRSVVTSEQCMSDFRAIVSLEGKILKPEDTIKMHERSLEFMKFSVMNEHKRKIVAISHHGVSWKSVDDKYKSQYLTAAFSSGILDKESISYQPWTSKVSLWIHGHTHSSFDYVIDHGDGDETHVVCNPKGYEFVANENPSFQYKIVEV